MLMVDPRADFVLQRKKNIQASIDKNGREWLQPNYE
jgi:hypothetical protein